MHEFTTGLLKLQRNHHITLQNLDKIKMTKKYGEEKTTVDAMNLLLLLLLPIFDIYNLKIKQDLPWFRNTNCNSMSIYRITERLNEMCN